MKLLVINGPNLNMLGVREPNLYGKEDYKALVSYIKGVAKENGVSVKVVQSNYEGKLVTIIQKAKDKFDGIIINAGAYTHTSVAILDALKSVGLLTVEVHLTDINSREEFRRLSYVSMVAEKQIAGKGFAGYKQAIEYFAQRG
ncbi:MAG: type II 3-dehydroquinate dehydratase [Clostridia bacterium]|nr:type II 3-dehydroquinate dehydratase [Clostridia bacterium]